LIYNKKVAVLCNGPSRSLYDPSKEYEYRIGCNIPWTTVNSTVIADEHVLRVIARDNTLLNCPAWFSEESWRATDEWKVRDYINNNKFFLGFIKRGEGLSSGNIACGKLIELGYTDIDIYGADAFWTLEHHNGVKSYTREFLPDPVSNNTLSWRLTWQKMIKNNPNVTFNFIKE
jgi:hypothetical protein